MAFKQRKFRAKAQDEEAEEDDGAGPVIRPPQPTAKPGAAAAAAKASSRSSAGSSGSKAVGSKLSLLSFDEEGDDPGFVSKKDSKKDKQRSKLARAPLPDLPPPEPASQTLRSTAGEYTAERLKELQRNAISFNAAKLAPPAEAEEGAGLGGGGGGSGGGREPLIKLSGSFKPAGAPKDDRFTMGSSTALVKPPAASGPGAAAGAGAAGAGAREDESMLLPPPPRPGGGGAAGANGGAGGGEEEDDDGDLGIPDQETILAAKAKRERLRQAHLAPDYIPTSSLGLGLGGGKGRGGRAGSVGPGASGEEGAEGGKGAGSGSDDEAEAEERMRIKFSGNDATRARDMQQFNRALGGDDDEEAFAQSQLRKALRFGPQQQQQQPLNLPHAHPHAAAGGNSFPPPAALAGAEASITAAGTSTYPYPYPTNHMRGAGAGAQALVPGSSLHVPSYGGGGLAMAGGGGRLAAISAAGDAVVASLQEGLRRMQNSHKQVQLNQKRTSENLAAALARIEGLEAELKAAGDKYLYVQQLRGWVADLCDCLQVKSAIVEELEDSRLELMEDRAAAARSAAASSARDLSAPAEAAVAAAMGVLGRGGAAAAATAAAEAAARDAEEALLDEEGPPQLDEFGRNVNLQRRRELEERMADRRRLLALEGERLAAARGGAAINALDTEGEPGDGQSSRYSVRYREMVEAGATVFADADEDFASIAAVKKRLEEWKSRYPKDYTNAYMHLSTPALFAPFVRLELLSWDPLYGAADGAPYKGFDQQQWYGELFEYGMGSGEGAEALVSEDDPDSELVPQLVRKLVLPLALHWIERCWDVTDVQHTRAVAALASELLVYVPAEEERMVELLSVVRGSLERAVDEAAALPPWPPAVLACSTTATRVLFRRFRLAVRLLHCVSAFEGLLSRSLLVGLALGRVVVGGMMPYLRAASEGGQALSYAVATVEAVVGALHPEWCAGGMPADGAVFGEHVASLGRVLEQQRGDAGKAQLAARLARVLARIGGAERSGRLAAAFGVKA